VSVSSGDFALEPLIRKLTEVGDGRILTLIRQNLAEEAVDLVKQGFERESEPFGAPWAPLKRRTGKILQDTGRLKNSFTPRATADGFRIVTNVAYAQYHQRGTRRMVARPLVPTGTHLPDAWLVAFHRVVDEILVDFFKT